MSSQKKKTPTEYLKLKRKCAQFTMLSEFWIPTEAEVIYLDFS